MSSAPVQAPPLRRWFVLLLVLACLDVATVTALLSRNQRLLAVSQQMEAASQSWADGLAEVASVRQSAADLASGRSSAVPGETGIQRLDRIAQAFEASVARAARQIASVPAPLTSSVGETLDEASRLVHTAAAHRGLADAADRAGEYERASRESAQAAEAMAGAQDLLADVERAVGSARRATLAAHRDTAAAILRADLLIVVANVLLVVIVVVVARVAASPQTAVVPSMLLEPGDARPEAFPRATMASSDNGIKRALPVAVDPADVEGLDEFPSELDSPPQRRAG